MIYLLSIMYEKTGKNIHVFYVTNRLTASIIHSDEYAF